MNSRSSASMGSGSQVSSGAPPAAGSSPVSSSCHQWSRSAGHGHRAADRVGAGPLHHHHVVDARRLGHGDVDVALEPDPLAAPPPTVRRHHHLGLGVQDPVAQGVRGEPAEHDRVHGADPGAGQHGDGQFGHHRHVDGHPVTTADPEALQHVGEPAHLEEQVGVADGAGVARLTLPVERHLVAPSGRHVAVQTVVRDVERAAVEPAGEGEVPAEHGVPRPEPVERARLLGPELGAETGRLVVDGGIGGDGALPEGGGRGEDAFLREVVLDRRLVTRCSGHRSPSGW